MFGAVRNVSLQFCIRCSGTISLVAGCLSYFCSLKYAWKSASLWNILMVRFWKLVYIQCLATLPRPVHNFCVSTLEVDNMNLCRFSTCSFSLNFILFFFLYMLACDFLNKYWHQALHYIRHNLCSVSDDAQFLVIATSLPWASLGYSFYSCVVALWSLFPTPFRMSHPSMDLYIGSIKDLALPSHCLVLPFKYSHVKS